MYGGRMTTPCTPAGGTLDRYTCTSVAYPGGEREAGGGGGTMDRYISRNDRWSPPEMEISHCCRSFLMSRLRAAEQMNDRLSEEAKDTNNSRLRSIRPPGEFNVDLAIEQLRAQVASLLDSDIRVISQLLYINDQMEELRWQRKFGDGSPWTPSTLLSGSCTADTESVDYDPDIEPLNPLFAGYQDPRDPRRHVINGCFGDDVTDDVFQNDETVMTRPPPNSNNTCVSSEVRFKVTPSGLKVSSPDKVNRSKVEIMVNSKKVDNPKVISSHAAAELKVKGVDEINDKLKMAKVEFKVAGAKSVVETKAPSSQVEVRILVNSDDAKGQGGQHKVMLPSESPGHTGAAQSSQHTPLASCDVRQSSGPIRQQRIANEANRERKSEHGPQLRIVNPGQGIRMGHAGITTPARVKLTPFSVAGDKEESETVIVHL